MMTQQNGTEMEAMDQPESTLEPVSVGKAIQNISESDDRMKQLEATFQSIPARDPEIVTREKHQQERNARTATWHNLLHTTKLGDRFHDATLETFTVSDSGQENAIAALREYSAQMPDEIAEGSGILMIGGVGRGKDHLMIALMREAILRHGIKPVLWKNGLDLYGDLRDAIKSDTKESELIKRFSDPRILAISDPCPPAGSLTAHQAVMLQRIIDSRYRMQRPIWCTCNASGQKDLGERIGIPVADRLADNALVILCTWPGHRKPKRVINATN